MKNTLRLLPFHLRMLPHAVTIAYPFRSSRGLHVHPTLQTRARLSRSWNALPTADKGKPANQDQTPVQRLRTPYQTPEYPHGGRSGTRTHSTQHVVPTYLPLDHLPPCSIYICSHQC
jgi:hypothetical protein